MQIASGITVPWPSTNASIPTGFTRVAAMDSRYAKGTAAGVDPAVTGGAATHTHTDPGHTHSIASHTHTGTTSGSSDTTRQEGSGVNFTWLLNTHTHTASTSGSSSGTSGSTAGGWSSASSDPDSLIVIWIASDGTPTGFPNGSIVFWDNSGAAPTGSWNLVASDKFLKGAAAAGDGGGTTGGSHSHSGSSHTHVWNGHTHTGGTSGSSGTTTADNGGSQPQSSLQNPTSVAHTHTYSFGSGSTSANGATSSDSGSTSYEPTYAKLGIYQNATGAADLQNGMIACWTGLLSAIPTNWVLCDGTGSSLVDMRGKHVKGAANLAAIGGTGGAAGHSHSDPSGHTHAYDHNHTMSFAAASPGNSGNDFNPAGKHTPIPHTHSATSGTASGTSGSGVQTAPTNSSTEPAFYTVAFIKLTGLMSVTIDSPTEDQVMTSSSFLVDWSISGGTGIQNDYRVVIYENDQTTIKYDSGTVASATTSHTIPSSSALSNNSSYYIQVTMHDSAASEGISGFRHITTSWTPPATITGIRTEAVSDEQPVRP